jgi:carbon storage regulator CsrA
MVCIGPNITVTVISVAGQQVKLGFAAPSDIRVDREEIRARVDAGIPHRNDRSAVIARGLVWCIKCGAMRSVNGGQCMRSGWPLCCGQTMTIDSPQEREAFAKRIQSTSGVKHE